MDYLTRAVGWLRRNNRVAAPDERPVKVNLGSSLLVAPGWLNLDGALLALFAGWPAPVLRSLYRLAGIRAVLDEDEFIRVLRGNQFVHHDMTYGIPLPDESVDYVFSSHFLEHLTKAGGEQLMTETLRVLRPGGVVRILVPDLEQAIAAYGEGRKEEALEGIFEGWELGDYARHRYMYDYDLLAGMLERVGFTGVRRRQAREGLVPDLDVLDRRENSLFVEAARPS